MRADVAANIFAEKATVLGHWLTEQLKVIATVAAQETQIELLKRRQRRLLLDLANQGYYQYLSGKTADEIRLSPETLHAVYLMECEMNSLKSNYR